jgi:hypothetical protein
MESYIQHIYGVEVFLLRRSLDVLIGAVYCGTVIFCWCAARGMMTYA